MGVVGCPFIGWKSKDFNECLVNVDRMYIDGQKEHKLYTDVLRYTVHKNNYYIHEIKLF